MSKEKVKTAPGTKEAPTKFPSPIRRTKPSVKPDTKACHTPEEEWDNLSWEAQRG